MATFSLSPRAFLPLSGIMTAIGLSLALAYPVMHTKFVPKKSPETLLTSNDTSLSSSPDNTNPKHSQAIQWNITLPGIENDEDEDEKRRGGRHPMPLSQPADKHLEAMPDKALQVSDLKELHTRAVERFVMVQGFGIQRFRGPIADFSLTDTVGEDDTEPSAMGDFAHATIHVELFQLVSLLKHSEPRVYLHKDLPLMQASDVPTRDLDEFETLALKKLESGEEMIVKVKGDRTWALGAIRAADQCLKCHDAQKGELLGAFTYSFRPVDKK